MFILFPFYFHLPIASHVTVFVSAVVMNVNVPDVVFALIAVNQTLVAEFTAIVPKRTGTLVKAWANVMRGHHSPLDVNEP